MISILLQLAALQSFLLFLFFLFQSPYRVSNTILAIFAILVSLLCLFKSIESIGLYLEYPHLIRIDWGVLLLLWPLIYLFIKYFVNNENRFDRKDFIHCIPYLLNLAVLLPFFIEDQETKIASIDHYTPFLTKGFYGYSIYFNVLSIAIGVQSLVYSKLIIDLVREQRRKIEQILSNTSRFGARWFFLIAYGTAGLSLIYLLSLVLSINSRYLDDYHQWFFLGLFVMILTLSYRSFYQPMDWVIDPPLPQPADTRPAYVLPEAELQKMAVTITTLFSRDKKYLDPDLTAIRIASEAGISRHHLSEVLARHFGMSFYDFVNGYRVREFQERVSSGKYTHLTLFGLALECGFSSKSSFNSIFKKATGVTPSQFAASEKKGERSA